jgi:hypothetical protein
MNIADPGNSHAGIRYTQAPGGAGSTLHAHRECSPKSLFLWLVRETMQHRNEYCLVIHHLSHACAWYFRGEEQLSYNPKLGASII